MSLYPIVRPISFAALGAVVLAACVTTTPPHGLSVDNVRALRLERVEVAIDPAAQINWSELTSGLATAQAAPVQNDMTGSIPDIPEPPRLSPEQSRANAMANMREKARTVLEPTLKSTLNGMKPVNARVTVHYVKVAGFFEGLAKHMIIGPGAAQSTMVVSVDFIDARSGATVVSYPRTGLSTEGGYKLNMGTTGAISHDPIERMFASLNDRLTSWLLKA
jgi:hypothetical protein